MIEFGGVNLCTCECVDGLLVMKRHLLFQVVVCCRDLQNQAVPRYRGLIHGITTVVKEEGISGVYRGLLPTIAKQMGNQSIRFTVYTQIQAVCSSLLPW
jgi:hypothetical protein